MFSEVVASFSPGKEARALNRKKSLYSWVLIYAVGKVFTGEIATGSCAILKVFSYILVFIGLLPTMLYASGGGEILLIAIVPPLIFPIVISVIAHNLIGIKGQKIALPAMIVVSILAWFLVFGWFNLELEDIIFLSFGISILTLLVTILVRRLRQSKQTQL